MRRFFHWRSLFRRKQFESGMAEEFAFHQEARIHDLIREGLSTEEARRRVAIEFGAVQRYSEECREAHRLQWLDELWLNLRYGVRSFRRSPAFSAAAILSLALGIGVNTVIFSIFDSLLLRPLPVDHPEQIAFVETQRGTGHSFPNYKEFRDSNSTFSELAGYRISPMSLEQGGSPARIWGYLATGNYFDALGVQPAIGRFFHQENDRQPGSSPYAVLSYRSWQARFGGDPKVVGETVRINGLPYTILGVAPAGFHGTELFYWPEIWVPMMMQPQIEAGNPWLDNRYTRDTWIVGRVKPHITFAQATADLNAIGNDLGRRFPDVNQGLKIGLAPPGLVGSAFREPVRLFTGGVLLLSALVLLTACANLASLMLARATDREREMAIRSSIGAGRARLVRQVLTESLLLSLIGGALGCTLAVTLSRLLSLWHAPMDFPVQFDVSADWRVLSFAVLISLVTGVLFGAGPALRLSGIDVNQSLKSGAGFAMFKTKYRVAFRDLLVPAEITLCFVLVFGSILSLRGLQRALTMPLGIQPEHVVTAAVDLGLAGYSEPQGKAMQARILDAIRELPGVSAAGYGSSLPLSIDHSSTSVASIDEPLERERKRISATFYDVSPGYLSTLGIPLLSGRDFDVHDNEHSPRVAIINRTFAKVVMHTENPVGKNFRFGFGNSVIQVVGMVEDGKYVSLTEAPRPALFWPVTQQYNATTTLVVKSVLPASQVIQQIRRRTSALDSRLPVYGAGSLNDMLGFALFPMHAAAIALGAFGILALMLAVTGIHGIVAYAVARKTREIGIRIAIGAGHAQILRFVLGKLLALVTAGLIAGMLLGLAAGRALNAIIFGVSPSSPGVLLVVFVVLLTGAALSCWGPALRALRVQPTMALRCE
jgi:predicted permease